MVAIISNLLFLDKDDGDGPPAKKQKKVLQPASSEVVAVAQPTSTTPQKVEAPPTLQPPQNDENTLPTKPSELSVVYMELC